MSNLFDKITKISLDLYFDNDYHICDKIAQTEE